MISFKKSAKSPKKDAAGTVQLMPFHEFTDFKDLVHLIKIVLACNDIEILKDFYKSSTGVEFELPMKRNDEHDRGYVRNKVFLISVIGYCTVMKDDVSTFGKLSNLSPYLSWLENLEYSEDGPVFDKNGRILEKFKTDLKKRTGPIEVVKKSKNRREDDEISAELDNAGSNFDKYIEVVVSYDIDKSEFEKYKKLNPGLMRMNIENRLRKLIKEKNNPKPPKSQKRNNSTVSQK